jgi:hypothetical protein
MSEYSPEEHKPLFGYAALTALFNGAAAGYVIEHRRAGRDLPERVPLGDFLLLAAGTHKLSRLIANAHAPALRSGRARTQATAGPLAEPGPPAVRPHR